MEYLIVTNSQKLKDYIKTSTYHVQACIDGGIIIDTASCTSETEEIFKKLYDVANVEFSVVRLSYIQPLGRNRSIIDVCSTSWEK